MKKKYLLLTAFTAAVALVASGSFPQTAQAAFPGANGKITFLTLRDGNYEIYSMNADGSGQVNLTNNSATETSANWSPDGKKLAFNSNRDGNNEIYVMNADGSGQTRLTNNGAIDNNPAWSPDGSKIGFVSNRDGNNEIYVMNADGSGQTNLTNNPAQEQYPLDWSPDGTKILFSSNRDGNFEVYVMNADGSGQTNLTNNPAFDYNPDWSPDGTKVAFVSYRAGSAGSSQVYSMNANGSGQSRLTNNPGFNECANWSPDGNKLAFCSGSGQAYDTYTINPDGTGQTQVTSNVGVEHPVDWQPLIGTTITDPNNPSRTITTIAASESYPVLDYTVDPNQTLILDGRLCDVTVASGGILMGTGTACTITVQPGGTIAPGHSPGCMTSGNLSLAGTYSAEIGGTTACTQYDQLQVTGTVTVGGNLNISLVNGFTPKAGDSFTLISNDGTDPVSGTFAGLAEGSTITISGAVFKISYVGGSGNDVVLTAQASAATPTAPNTGTSQTPIAPSLLLLIAGTVVSLVGLRAYTKRRGYKISSRA